VGAITRYLYGAAGATVVVTDPQGTVVSCDATQLDSQDRACTALDCFGRRTSTVYGDARHPGVPTVTFGPDGRTSTQVLNTLGNVTSATSPRGDLTSNTYDTTTNPFGLLTRTQTQVYTGVVNGTPQYRTLPATTYSYWPGTPWVATVTSAKPGHPEQTVTTSTTYDAEGNAIRVETPGPDGVTITSGTTITKHTDGSRTVQSYPRLDTPTEYTETSYDRHGLLTETVAMPANRRTTYAYNAADQVTAVTSYLPEGTVESRTETGYAYPGGAAIDSKQFQGAALTPSRWTRTHRGPLGETLSETTVNPLTLQETVDAAYTYDSLYRQVGLSDGTEIGQQHVQATSGTQYGTGGRTLGAAYPGGGCTRYASFDLLGRLTRTETPRTDGTVLATDTQYNADGQVTVQTDRSGRGGSCGYQYDGSGRLTARADAAEMVSYAYDAADAVTATTHSLAGLAQPVTVTPTPNPDGSQGARTLQVGAGPTAWNATWSNQYDDHQRLARVTNNRTGAATTWTYDSEGRLARQESQTAENVSIVYTTYEYDAAGRLSAQRNYKGDGTLLSAFTNFTYDGKGNRTGLHMNIATLPQASLERSHSYTTQDRLACDTLSANDAPRYTHSYAYDTAGNPTTFAGETRSYNLNNQLDAYLPAGKADTPANWVTEAFVYDEDGNPTTYKDETCTYNAHGNLLSYGTTLTAGYNADGLRIWKESGGQRSYYLYDGEMLLAETNAAGTVTSAYTWGANGLICRDAAAGSTYYLYDPQGSVVQRVDSSGNVIDTDLYDAWGNLQQGTPGSDPVGYCGQHGYYTDVETGLVLCTHRYYDPTIGRWVNRDPIGTDGGNNIYCYCLNNPLNSIDIDGLAQIFLCHIYSHITTGMKFFIPARISTNIGVACLWRLKGGTVLVIDNSVVEAGRVANAIENMLPGFHMLHPPHIENKQFLPLPHYQTLELFGHTMFAGWTPEFQKRLQEAPRQLREGNLQKDDPFKRLYESPIFDKVLWGTILAAGGKLLSDSFNSSANEIPDLLRQVVPAL